MSSLDINDSCCRYSLHPIASCRCQLLWIFWYFHSKRPLHSRSVPPADVRGKYEAAGGIRGWQVLPPLFCFRMASRGAPAHLPGCEPPCPLLERTYIYYSAPVSGRSEPAYPFLFTPPACTLCSSCYFTRAPYFSLHTVLVCYLP